LRSTAISSSVAGDAFEKHAFHKDGVGGSCFFDGLGKTPAAFGVDGEERFAAFDIFSGFFVEVKTCAVIYRGSGGPGDADEGLVFYGDHVAV
jgi:hypothetical protein